MVQLYRGMNPDFFTGTVVEQEAEAEFAKYQGSGVVSYETIAVERRGHTACIRLDRPEVLNAINDQMIAEINDACGRARSRSGGVDAHPHRHRPRACAPAPT